MLRRTAFIRPARPERAPRPWPGIQSFSVPAVISGTRATPKNPRYVDRNLLDMARGRPCLLQSPICNHNPETVVACHGAGLANGKGLGLKVGDHLTAWGCSDCNHFTDAFNRATASEKAAVFAAGHARQVAWWERIAADHSSPVRDIASARAVLAYLASL